jgi:hypothetical protein
MQSAVKNVIKKIAERDWTSEPEFKALFTETVKTDLVRLSERLAPRVTTNACESAHA